MRHFCISNKFSAYGYIGLLAIALSACGGRGNESNGDGAGQTNVSSLSQPTVFQESLNVNASSGIVPGWPNYIAMGTVTLNQCTTTGSDPSTHCNDEQPHPVDAVFKYAGFTGKGDRGYIPFPGAVRGTLKFAGQMAIKDQIDQRPVRPVMVQYTANYSNDGQTIGTDDFALNNMAKNLINLSLNAAILSQGAQTWQSNSVYGSIILNPDALGYIQQNSMLSSINARLASRPDAVNLAVARAMNFMDTPVSWNNQTFYPYGVTATATPAQIALSIPAGTWTPDPTSAATWPADSVWYPNAAMGVTGRNPNAPDFANNFSGWVQANNWLIQHYGSQNITFGWQENLWANGSSDWVRNTDPAMSNYETTIASAVSNPVIDFLSSQQIYTGMYKPNFVVLDRYEMDDTNAGPYDWFFNDTAWKNMFTFSGQISAGLTGGNGHVPVMLWQMPGGHIQTAATSEPDQRDGYGATLTNYLFGDSNLILDSEHHITNLSNYWSTLAALPASNYYSLFYNYTGSCAIKSCSPVNFLQMNGYDWSANNGNLQKLAQQSHVFAILWGGGQTTGVNVIYPNTVGSDGEWLANKIVDYYANPTLVVP